MAASHSSACGEAIACVYAFSFSGYNYLYLSSFVHLFGTIQEAYLKPSRRTFAFYLLGYLLLVITPSVVFIRIFPCKVSFYLL